MTQMPSVGRIVHYHSYGTPGGEYLPEARAAVVTAIQQVETATGTVETWHAVSLAILNPTGMFFNQSVPYSLEPKPGHWSWPPRA